MEETNGMRFVCRFLSCHIWASILLLGGKRGRVESAFPAFAAELPLAQNSFCVKEAYFRVTYYGFLQIKGSLCLFLSLV